MINQISSRVIFITLLIIVVFGFALYLNSLNGGFIWDDEFLVKDNGYIKTWSKLPHIFTENIGMGAGREGPCYRPFQMITYMVDYSFWRLNVVGYHLANTLFHILVALAIYWLINILYGDWRLSFLTSILFLANPLHTEAVAYISSRADSLSALFILLCIIFYIKQSPSRKIAGCFLTVLTYILALLSKEYSLIVPVLLILHGYIFKKKLKIREFLPILIVTFIYITAKLTVLRSVLSGPAPTTSLLQRIPGFLVAITEYCRLLLLPVNLHMEYAGKLFSFTDPRAIPGIAILFGLLIYAFIKRKTDKLITFSIYWFFISLLPLSNLYPLNAFMAEHWLYLPSLGFFLILAKGLISLFDIKRLRVVAVISITFLLSFYSYLTIKQNNYWKDPVSFYKTTLQYAPNSYRLYLNLGRTYAGLGNKEEAIKAYQKAIELNPKNANSYCNLGVVYGNTGNIKGAIELYRKALVIDPNYADVYYNLGNAYAAQGNFEEAIISYNKAIEIAPKSIHLGSFYNNLAAIYFNSGKLKEALKSFEKALDIDPDNATTRDNIKVIQSYGAKVPPLRDTFRLRSEPSLTKRR